MIILNLAFRVFERSTAKGSSSLSLLCLGGGMVDSPVLGTGVERRGGSSPPQGTNQKE